MIARTRRDLLNGIEIARRAWGMLRRLVDRIAPDDDAAGETDDDIDQATRWMDRYVAGFVLSGIVIVTVVPRLP